jgi:quinoprotein glucose dehydrogenase
MKLKVALSILLAMVLAVSGVVYKYDLIAKVRHIGNSPSEAIFYLFQLIQKDGIINTLMAVRGKLGNDPRLGLGYSLADRASYPPVESASDRAALPEFKIIPGVDPATLPPSRDGAGRDANWHRSNGANDSSKYSVLDQINRENVRNLQVAWTYSAGPYQLDENMKNGSPVETNPIMVNGRLFVASIDSHLVSIDAATGKEIWRVKLPPPVARRGLVWEPNADFTQSRLFVPTGRGVYAINASSGEIQQNFGNKGQVGDQLSLIAPVIAGDRLVIALIKPALEAYDLRTGKLLWTRPLLEKPAVANALLTGGVPWAGMSYDPARSRVFVSTGNPRPELWGATRPGENRHSNSVVAIDTRDGGVAWAFQEVAHDLWDVDVPSPPVLTTITKGGRKIDVIAAVTKMGNTLLLDRDSGKPIFDYRLRRAPVSTIPGEQTWPYQPSLELPEPVLKQVFDETDVTDLSEKDGQWVRQRIRGAKQGFYEPPVLGGKVVIFGVGGGAEWPGAAVDAKTGILYIPSNHSPWVIRANYRDLKGESRSIDGMPGNTLYQASCASCHGRTRDGFQEPDSKGGSYFPPLTAITFIRSRDSLTSVEFFNDAHRGVTPAVRASRQDLETLFAYFFELDQLADKDKALAARTFWGPLLDSNGNPGSKPPWGLLTALDLNTGKKVWQLPFGEYQKLRRNGQPVKGQQNVGGAMVTAGGLVFATGTIDSRVRAFDSSTGKELWSFELPAAGSAPPSTYQINGTQYVVVVASARPKNSDDVRFDKIVAFRLPGGGLK